MDLVIYVDIPVVTWIVHVSNLSNMTQVVNFISIVYVDILSCANLVKFMVINMTEINMTDTNIAGA